MLCWSSCEEIPHAQGKRNPSKMVGVARGHRRADTLKPYSQETRQANHTRTTALSNSMKLSHVRSLWGLLIIHSFWSYFSTDLQQHIGHLLSWGVPLSVSYHFAFSYCSWGSQGKNTEVACHSLLQWTTFCQTSPP